jgi:RHS repeat-associated protein
VTTVYVAGLYEWQNGAVTKYYEGGAFRRTGYASDNGVFYVLQDHLRSTSVLVNQNGTVNSRNYFYPYGGNRNGAFSGLTTKRFTGQYQESSLPGGEGLYYYNARWYDARLTRFISADTIVPSPLAPQTLNRYAYVSGNPLRYQDPTGHRECEDGDCLHTGPVIIKPPSFVTRAKWLLEALGGVNDLEAMARIVELGARLYPSWDQFLPAMGEIFTGSPQYGTLGLIAPGVSSMLGLGEGGCAGLGREPHDCPDNGVYFKDTGFHLDFQDGHNQPYHTWGYIAQTATPGDILAFELNLILSQWGNLVHEVGQSFLNWDSGWGTSWQDWVLSEAAVNIGFKITYGLIASPVELADHLRRDLGSNGPGSHGKLQWLEATNGKLRGSP